MMRTILMWVLLAGLVQCQLFDNPVFINDYGLELPVEQDTSGATDPDDVEVPTQNWDSVNNASTFASRFDVFIIGGQDSAYGDHPYICSLHLRAKGYWYFACGAAIYNEHTVMTAAHCVEGSVASELRVVCGDYRRFSRDAYEVTKQIVHVTMHPRFMNTFTRGFPADIAVMRVESPLVFNDFVSTIPIPKRTTPLPKECQLIGWGRTDASAAASVDILQEGSVEVIPQSRCQMYWGRRRISLGQVCFLDPASVTTACFSDSGSPAVCGGYLVGLTSFGVEGCLPFAATVYTSVSFYRRWLKHNAYDSTGP